MNYWQKRAIDIQNDAKDLALISELRLQQVYRNHLRECLVRYDDLMKKQADPKARYRTDRVFRNNYNRLINHIGQSLEALASITNNETLNLLVTVYKNTMISYGVQSFDLLSTTAIQKIVTTPWNSDGLVFSDRIWRNTNSVKAKLSNYLLSSIVKGEGIQKTAKTIQHEFGVSLGQAKRLIRTETAAIYTEASIDSYDAMGIEYYEIIGEPGCHDEGVCPVGTIFRVDEAGSNDTPPFHPNCKCCIAPVVNYKMA